jgi:integration host factor subunit alpha
VSDALTRAALVAAVREGSGVTQKQARELVDSILRYMCQSLSAGHNVTIMNFGTFHILDKSERTGRNPKTGEEHVIAARRTLSFRACARMRSLVEKGLQS